MTQMASSWYMKEKNVSQMDLYEIIKKKDEITHDDIINLLAEFATYYIRRANGDD
jgi:hypothetical protein